MVVYWAIEAIVDTMLTTYEFSSKFCRVYNSGSLLQTLPVRLLLRNEGDGVSSFGPSLEK